MSNQDKSEADRLTAKNSVEEYIYDIRGKLCEELEEFMLEEDRNKYSLELEDTENWLYEDGEFAEKPEYQKKLSELQVKGEAVKRRRYEFEARPEAINQYGQCLQLAQKAIDAYKVSQDVCNWFKDLSITDLNCFREEMRNIIILTLLRWTRL